MTQDTMRHSPYQLGTRERICPATPLLCQSPYSL